ncbi:MAG: RagB/SusD family nutrient uptake outer membrane protein [Bacteroides sp.]|nr:RagB/SusD family nutrient uptake outer membrane protein [Bacteroides sp.]
MKKYLIALFAACSMLSSCDMELTQPGVLDDVTAVQGAAELLECRNGLYSSLRGLTSGSYVTSVELQMDQFNGVTGNGTRGAQIANGQLTSSLSIAGDAFGGCYGLIANINYMLQRADAIIAGGSLTANDLANVNLYVGEAKVIRGYVYFYLLDHFCQNPATVDRNTEGLGMPLVVNYNPSGVPSTYPGRSTVQALIDQIDSDLTEGYKALEEYEKANSKVCNPNASYLNTYTVKALQARVALVIGDYANAAKLAKEVIANTKYKLTTGNDYVNMWKTDEGDELIFVPFVDASEYDYVNSFNDAWNYYQYMPTFSDYLPSYKTLMQYDVDNDIRFDAFFKYAQVTISSNKFEVMQFMKFPGNSEIRGTASNRYRNKPKPFRLSEQYLILAEASALNGNATDANEALKTLREARINNYQHTALAGQNLLDDIRLERSRELIGEGFRMSDLRRYGVGFTRDGEYPVTPGMESNWVVAGLAVTYSPNDTRYVWPIPADEIDINPQIAKQQNPGY